MTAQQPQREPYFPITEHELDLIKNDCLHPEIDNCPNECSAWNNEEGACDFSGNTLMEIVLAREPCIRPHTPAPMIDSLDDERLPFSISDEDLIDFNVWMKEHDRTATLALLKDLVKELEGYGECSDVESQRNFGISVVKTRLVALKKRAGEQE